MLAKVNRPSHNTGCPKSSFLYFIKLYKSVTQYDYIGLDKQIVQTKVVFQSNLLFHTCLPSFDSNIPFVYFRAKGAGARVNFSATYFFVLCSRNCSNSFLVFCEYHER